MNNISNKVSASLEERMKQLADKEDLHFLKTLLKFKHKECVSNHLPKDNEKHKETNKNDDTDFNYVKDLIPNINQEQQLNLFLGNSTISSIHQDIQESFYEESKINFELKTHKTPNNSKSQCFNNLRNIKQIEALLKQTKQIEEALLSRPFSTEKKDKKNIVYCSSHKTLKHNDNSNKYLKYNFISDKKVSHKTLIQNRKNPLNINYEKAKKNNHMILNTDNEKKNKNRLILNKNNTVKTISTLKSNKASNQINSIKFINCKLSNNKSNTEVMKSKINPNHHYLTHYNSNKVCTILSSNNNNYYK